MVCQKMKTTWYKGSLIVTDKMSIHYFNFIIIIHHKPFGTVWRNMVRHQTIRLVILVLWLHHRTRIVFYSKALRLDTTKQPYYNGYNE